MIEPNKLKSYAVDYIGSCIHNKIEKVTPSGKTVQITERRIPTINYFLSYYVPHVRQSDTICRKTFYNWKNGSDPTKKETATYIDDLFEAVAVDVVANEGKGIFYAKNKLGMTDKIQEEHKPFDLQGAVIKFMGGRKDEECEG